MVKEVGKETETPGASSSSGNLASIPIPPPPAPVKREKGKSKGKGHREKGRGKAYKGKGKGRNKGKGKQTEIQIYGAVADTKRSTGVSSLHAPQVQMQWTGGKLPTAAPPRAISTTGFEAALAAVSAPATDLQ
eukprot:TRINITY_DN55506_c0_g1_i1.p1 TRINITY_DN55506_c0_g1~~TRINITY_DN55506_c0_g1_i1.p1  ORF type:complete len:141 (-),score=20.88 TRINITY_DN55506_c0_g1_i1:19-417(-)